MGLQKKKRIPEEEPKPILNKKLNPKKRPSDSLLLYLEYSTWINQKRNELANLLENEKIDIIFLTETDSKEIKKCEDYKIQGFDTVLPLYDVTNPLIRIIGLIKSNITDQISIKTNLMSK